MSKTCKKIRILSIDGGGVRGLIPAIILAHLEQRLKSLTHNSRASLVDYFDLFAGTSTGSMIIACLLVKDENNRPRYSAAKVVKIYKENIAIIFKKPNLLQNIKSVSGLVDVKYNTQGMSEVLHQYFLDDELKDLLKPCLMPAYRIDSCENYYFQQQAAKKNSKDNYKIVDVLTATCAAPTYFPPAQISAIDQQQTACFIDGGIFAINPSLSAYAQFRHNHPEQHAKDSRLLSLGTGRQNLNIECEKIQHWGAIEWSDIGANIVSTATPDATNEQLKEIYNHDSNYLRLNADFVQNSSHSLDDSSDEYLVVLEKLAEKIIYDNQEKIDDFAKKLIGNNSKTQSFDNSRLTKYLDIAEQQSPNATAFIGLDTTLNYQKLKRHSLKLSNYLTDNLTNKNSKVVAIMLPNILPFPVALFAAWYGNKTVTLVNPLVSPDELLKQCTDAQVGTIIIANMFLNTLTKILSQTCISRIITVDMGDLQPKPKAYIVNALSFIKRPYFNRIGRKITCVKLSNILQNDVNPTRPERFIKLDNPIALLQYTGGTSGILKAAMLSHKNLLANIHQISHWLSDDINHTSSILTALPLYHIFALNVNLLLFVHLKARSILVLNARDIRQVIKPLKRYKIEVITGVNTLFAALMRQSDFSKLDWSRLKLTIAGGMATDAIIAKNWQAQTHKPIIQGYGLSECSPVVCVGTKEDSNFNVSVGKALIDTDIIILDSEGKHCSADEVGEIAIKGPQVMQSYWQKPQLNAEVFTKQGYFLSGDLGYLDADKNLFIVGRLKEMIIVSGFNVYPIDVENVLNQHPEVVESACIGVDDGQGGQSVKAFVVKKPKSTLSKTALIEYSQKHLTHYKIPKIIQWIEVLPKSAVGKILKRKLS